MLKRDYFIRAASHGAWRYRLWILSTFAETNQTSVDWKADPFAYRYVKTEEGHFFVDPDDPTQLEPIDDAPASGPLFGVYERFILRQGDFPNNATDLTTTYGNALFNAVAIFSCFGSTIPYVNKRLDPGGVEKLYVSNIVSNPVAGEVTPPGSVTVNQVQEHLAAMFDVIQNLDKLCVQSVSPKMLSVDPSVIAYRDKWLAENQDKLTDLTAVAEFIKTLVEMDKATFKGDPAEGFFIKGKQFDVVRLRVHILHGVEHSFDQDGTFELVTKSLSEGWDLKHFAALNNSLRDGSYNRGSKTALGGEAVKFFYRRYQNSRLVPGDCGTPIVIRRLVTKSNASRLVGNFYVNDAKELVRLDEQNVTPLVGKRIKMRDPAGCRAGGFDYCETCFGNSIDDSPNAMANVFAEVASRFMSIFMAKMHGTSLKTAHYDFKTWIT